MNNEENIEVVNPTTDETADQDSGIIEVNKGDLIKTTTGILVAIVTGVTGGVLYATPAEVINISDDGFTPVEKITVSIETPETKEETYSKELLDSQIAKIQNLKTIHEGYLQSFITALNGEVDEERIRSLNYQIKVANSRITSYTNAIAHYQRILDKIQPELDKLPVREVPVVEEPPVVDTPVEDLPPVDEPIADEVI